MAWPTTSEVEAVLIAMGFKTVTISSLGVATEVCSIGTAINSATLQAQAVAALEAATGFKPLIAPAEATAVKFDPPQNGMKLFIRQALCDVDSISVNGTALTEDEGYWVYSNDGQVQWIDFRLLPAYRIPKCIVITGKWGRFTAVPDVLKGIATRVMAALCIIQFREGVKAQPVRWNEGDVSESYGELMLQGAGEKLLEGALEDAKSYCFNAGAFF
jgi:hypothetical protein